MDEPGNTPDCSMATDICDIRQQIDDIDNTILELINRRLNLAKRIGELKKNSGNQVVDSTRESEILRRLTALNKGPLNPNVLHHIFIDIIAAARAIQASQRVAYLGPEATFTHLAATSHFGYSVTYVPQPSIREIFSEVEKGACDYGVVPVENSVEGSVRHTLDLFFESELCICAERYQPVSYDLLAQQVGLSAIGTVYAHSQALNQCRAWLNQYLPAASLKECSSSAFAVQQAMQEKAAAAIAGGGAAALFGLEAAASKIEDFSRPPTRFLVIGKERVRPSGKDKTSLMFALAHVPGALAGALTPITDEAINLLKIESRPTRHESWSHFFFIDLEGHLEEESIQRAIDRIRPHTLYLKNLGSYPMIGQGV
ncbi:prephenate dehydratase [Desulfosarcina ovata subsp. sediminis]|uniref:Bifunctional chorismate mutase/prephenate dehydratase n=1 Tax=Desulfosarcina ovata subsp. sediminis TaxID=885957 RepID=A0A5K7ZV86_9BACT|nr:prephenate dehydratase [Desulfosarcina ovata]BBO84081.1 prephenate dehydratase [Desulfosarcina ovata subsp. sediminis]